MVQYSVLLESQLYSFFYYTLEMTSLHVWHWNDLQCLLGLTFPLLVAVVLRLILLDVCCFQCLSFSEYCYFGLRPLLLGFSFFIHWQYSECLRFLHFHQLQYTISKHIACISHLNSNCLAVRYFEFSTCWDSVLAKYSRSYS